MPYSITLSSKLSFVLFKSLMTMKFRRVWNLIKIDRFNESSSNKNKKWTFSPAKKQMYFLLKVLIFFVSYITSVYRYQILASKFTRFLNQISRFLC